MSTQNDLRRGWNGGKWISDTLRLSIYLRDGLACVWCGRGIESSDGWRGSDECVRLSVDHAVPESCGGSDEHTNLITSCFLCNSTRGNKSVEEFAEIAGAYFGRVAQDIVEHIAGRLVAELPMGEAREIVRRREKARRERRKEKRGKS